MSCRLVLAVVCSAALRHRADRLWQVFSIGQRGYYPGIQSAFHLKWSGHREACAAALVLVPWARDVAQPMLEAGGGVPKEG